MVRRDIFAGTRETAARLSLSAAFLAISDVPDLVLGGFSPVPKSFDARQTGILAVAFIARSGTFSCFFFGSSPAFSPAPHRPFSSGFCVFYADRFPRIAARFRRIAIACARNVLRALVR